MLLVAFSSICFEGQHAGPSLFTFTLYIGVNDQIKTDTKEWTPSSMNCANRLVSLYTPLESIANKILMAVVTVRQKYSTFQWSSSIFMEIKQFEA